jgi:predicted kinase
MMNELLERDAVTLPMLGQLAGRLAQFHRDAERRERITRTGGANAFAKNWRDNLDAVSRFAGRTITPAQLTQLQQFSEAFLRDEASLLAKRDRDGWVRDCHGDLRSDAVCFDDSLSGGICLVDCIEFNDALRYTDTALDVAFLAMDLEFRERTDLADVFVGLYCAAMGDVELPLLVRAYRCYRAGVRGLVEGLTLDDLDVSREQKKGARERAKRYFKLAAGYTKPQKAAGMLMTVGPSGTGKSVLAGALASRLGAVYLATDVLRRELDDGSGREQRYAEEQRNRVYETMAQQAEAYMSEGRSVILDGTFIEKQQRAPFLELATRLKVPLHVLEFGAPPELIRRRQEQRAKETWTASEGSFDVYLAQMQHFKAPIEIDASRRIAIDSTLPLGTQLDTVVARLRRRR